MINHIEFPGLGLEFDINKVAIPLPFMGGIHWYGIIIVAGLLLGLAASVSEAKRLGEKADNIYDLVLFGLPAAIICARIYFVIFKFEDYKNNLAEIFKIWNGGIAIYGALIGAFLTCYIYCRAKKLSLVKYFDIGAYGFLVGQAVGRWGNFVNGEAYGAATNVLWRMAVNGILAHPTFLYESLWNISVFCFIWFTRKRKGFEGRAISLYMILYGVGRFWIEGLRTDSLMWGSIRVSQLVSVFVSIFGVLIYNLYKKRANRNIM
jgi:phosphatidylglycerol:prolipoprotein diacylglycerol transferase